MHAGMQWKEFLWESQSKLAGCLHSHFFAYGTCAGMLWLSSQRLCTGDACITHMEYLCIPILPARILSK